MSARRRQMILTNLMIRSDMTISFLTTLRWILMRCYSEEFDEHEMNFGW